MLNIDVILASGPPAADGPAAVALEAAATAAATAGEGSSIFGLTLAETIRQVTENAEAPAIGIAEAVAVVSPIPARTTESANAAAASVPAPVPPVPPAADTANIIELLPKLLTRVWNRPPRQELPTEEERSEGPPRERTFPDDDVIPFLIAAAFLAEPAMPIQHVPQKAHAKPASPLAEGLPVVAIEVPVPVDPRAHEPTRTEAVVQPLASVPDRKPMLEAVPTIREAIQTFVDTAQTTKQESATVGAVYDRPHTVNSTKTETEKNGPSQTAPTAAATIGFVVEETHTTDVAVPTELVVTTPPDNPPVGLRSETREPVSSEPRPQAMPPVDQPTADSRGQDLQHREKEDVIPPDLEIHLAVRPAQREAETIRDHTPEMHTELKRGDPLSNVRPTEISLPEPKAHAVEPARNPDIPATSQSEQWSQVEKSNVLSQLVEKARSLRWDRNSEIVVSLKPESLGRISMRASLVDRTMVATITAESERVRDLIQLELPVIQRSLQDSGIPAKVAVSQQNDLSLNDNSSSNGQPRFRQTTPVFTPEDEAKPAGPPSRVEVPDSRYSTNSVHLIA